MAIVFGTSARDILRGTSSADEIYGLQGDDVIFGSAGGDRIDGGANDDTVNYSFSSGPVTIDLRQVLQTGGDAQGDQLYSIENVVGSRYADYLHASQTTRLLEGGAGADMIYGWQGQGTASYANSPSAVRINLNEFYQQGGDAEGDYLFNIHDVLGSAYDDRIYGDSSGNVLTGGRGNDVFRGDLNNDRIDGGEGRDTVLLDTINGSGVTVILDNGAGVGTAYYNGEQDTLISIEDLVATDFADILWGSNADNLFHGGGSADQMHGADGGDELRGGSGNDELFGDAGRDRLFGDGDNDLLTGGADGDQLDGGDGMDTAVYSDSPAGVIVSLAAGATNSGGDAANDTLVRIENLTGSAFDDRLTGDGLGNVLNGGDGNDILRGGGGRDVLIGGRGDDILSGGIDGARDTYRFQLFNEGSQLNIGNDTIMDWEPFDRVVLLNGSPDSVNLAQSGNNTVITIDNVLGSITVLNSQVSDFDYLLV
jgi:Ca2+-binding RTX toxin-like protein